MNFSKRKPNFKLLLFNVAFCVTFLSASTIGNRSSLAIINCPPLLLDNNNCLEKYFGKPEELLTKDLVSEFVDFNGADVEVAKVSEQIIRDKNFAQVNCEWKDGRKRRIVRLKQITQITQTDKTSVEQFHFQYHTRTKEEQAEQTSMLDAEVEKKTTYKNAKTTTDAIGTDFEYEKVEELGDAAVWEHKVNDLKVLVGDYMFTLNVDLDKGNTNNLEKAKLIAQAIIDKACN